MKSILVIVLFLMSSLSLSKDIDNRVMEKAYEMRKSYLESLIVNTNDIVFIGDSITHLGEGEVLFSVSNIRNFGISGDSAKGVLNRIDHIVKGHPKKIFLMIGVNDLLARRKPKEIMNHIGKIVRKVKKESPETKLYIQSILPVYPDLYAMEGRRAIYEEGKIQVLNNQLYQFSIDKNLSYIDLYSSFKDKEGERGHLLLDYTSDGIHLSKAGYDLWFQLIKPYLEDSL